MKYREVLKYIDDVANEMPVVCELTHELQLVSGETLHEQGMKHFEDGTKILKGMIYQQEFPVIMAINHKRRMVEAYKKGGEQKLLEYIDTVTVMALTQNDSLKN